jgi:hypothetical protein
MCGVDLTRIDGIDVTTALAAPILRRNMAGCACAA